MFSFVEARLRGLFEVWIDQGGLRIKPTGKGRGVYIAMAALDAATLETFMGETMLVLDLAGGKEHIFAVAHPAPLELLAAIDAEIAAYDKKPESSRTAELARKDRPLLTWLSEGVTCIDRTATYREAAPVSEVDAAVREAHEAPEIRAVATYAVLCSGDASAFEDVARLLRTVPLPPVVVAAAWLAPGGDVLVPTDALAEVVPFLSDDDRAALASFDRTAKPLLDAVAIVARVDDEIAKKAADEAAALAALPHPRSNARARTMAGVSVDPMIGRTWSL